VSVSSNPVQQSVLFALVASHQLMAHNFANFWPNIFELINGPCIYIYTVSIYSQVIRVSNVGRLGSISSLVPSSTGVTLSTAMLGAH